MISHKLKFIFIHIPKTSGNSLSMFLKDFIDNDVLHGPSNMGEKQGIKIICEKTKQGIKHRGITYYKNTYGEKINDYFKFTIVRNHMIECYHFISLKIIRCFVEINLLIL